MLGMSSCPFCAIAEGTLAAAVVHADEHVVAFLDRAPICVGHTLVVPRGHYADMTTMPDDVLARVMAATKALAARYRCAWCRRLQRQAQRWGGRPSGRIPRPRPSASAVERGR